MPEGVAVDLVAIAKEVRRQGVVREGVYDLLGRPGGGGMFCHVEVEDTSAMVGEEGENEEHAQARSGNREEIAGHQVPDMVVEERSPGLRWRGASLREKPGDGALWPRRCQA